MKREDLQRAADPATYTEALANTAPSEDAGHSGHAGHDVVRTDIHNGHTIEIRSTYMITVDGKPVTAHMHVDNDGNVICHAVPVYRSASMIDVVRRLIDVFPDDFPAVRRGRTKPPTDHHHDHGGHG